VACSAYAGIMTIGELRANDPEGDAVRFEILSYPQKGTLTLSGNEYRYTAFENSTGSDSFSVVAIDRYGNRSGESEISVNVMERESALTYTDMQGHAAHSAALTLSYCGALSGTVIGGEAVFYPDAEITSCEFIAALVTALSLDTQNANTAVFSDTDSIPPHLLPALGTAVNKGWVAINETFSPSKPITRAQAGKILCSALELNLDPIPGLTLGEQALLVLASRGIMPLADGALAVDHPVTRADAAMAICRVLDCI